MQRLALPSSNPLPAVPPVNLVLRRPGSTVGSFVAWEGLPFEALAQSNLSKGRQAARLDPDWSPKRLSSVSWMLELWQLQGLSPRGSSGLRADYSGASHR